MPQPADATNTQTVDTLALIKDCVSNDLQAIDSLIIDELISNVPLIKMVCRYIINSGGKRLRPLCVVLSARACGYTDGNAHHDLAAIIEFIHTATLLHDDVVDESLQRRGQSTANAKWGNQASILVGDFLYSRAFQIITRHNKNAIMRVLANATNAIAEGEVMQLANQNNCELSEANYHEVILCKTAKLFEAAAAIGAIIATDDTTVINAMTTYGQHLGLAFQVIDDVLDYTADQTRLGKNLGDDLADGKITLPLIYALQHADTSSQNIITEAISTGDSKYLPRIQKILQQTKAIDYCYDKASKHSDAAKAAIDILPNSPFTQALYRLADFTIDRNF